ncbi:unnamed protein product, partial [Menidia menidia]
MPPISGFSHPVGSLIVSLFSTFCRSAQPPSDWSVPQSSRLKYRQLFNSHDKMMSGHLTGAHHPDAVQSSSDSAGHNMDGKLTAEEFILAMHLIDMAMSGLPLPPVLPPDYIPPTFSVQSDQKSVHEEVEEEAESNQEKKLPGNLELEKRRQALQEQQRKEQERLAALEREEQERK